ncbi:methyltransferase-like 26 [Phlebotomus argentipes]|uniref:methyltransferase-like 26 n=1 Tax=Phlebotomus argentipes TaxID=94469 RepID=UPI0028929A98|nr:methyltransferase-like 26 [Phlebotomus argentipes]
MLRNPSAERNRDAILDVLKRELAPSGECSTALEVASGTGQHVVHFAAEFPHVSFQPSEITERFLASIQGYVSQCPARNIHPPVLVDITLPCESWTHELFSGGLRSKTIDYIICINMIHITPIETTEGLFRNSSRLLRAGGLLITYGPFAENGVIAPDSNVNFDRMLRSQDPRHGIKDLLALQKLATNFRINLVRQYAMPANNRCVIWQKV